MGAFIVPMTGTHRFYMMEKVIHGTPAGMALRAEVDRLTRTRVFLVTNRSLAGSPKLTEIVEFLGSLYVGRYEGVTAHGPRRCVVEGAEAARAAGADLLVAIGGGSVIDATKVMQLCLRHSIREAARLDEYAGKRRSDPSTRPPDADRWIRSIAIPTTLSAAEFTWFGGASDPERGVKESFSNSMMIPQVVIMDPQMTLETPDRLLVTTGMKAVDHAAERLASLASNPYNDAVSGLALRILGKSLRGVHADPTDVDARGELQYGAFLSMCGAAAGGTVGISHAIGHALGAHCGVPHGETSCVMLPAVMNWNRSSNADRQLLISEALGSPQQEAGAALADLVSYLGLPRSLRDVNVKRDDIPPVARKAFGDILAKYNPRTVRSPADIEEILEAAW
jgi:maleylacetate reductase